MLVLAVPLFQTSLIVLRPSLKLSTLYHHMTYGRRKPLHAGYERPSLILYSRLFAQRLTQVVKKFKI